MNLHKKTINPIQLLVFLMGSFLGVRQVGIVREVTMKAGNDGWIVMLVGAGLVLPLVYLTFKVAKRFPNKTFIEVNELVLGKYLGKLPTLLTILTLIGLISVNSRMFADVLKVFLLPITPIEMLLLTMLFTTMYLVPFGLGAITRIMEIFVPIIVLFYFFIMIFSIPNTDFSNLLPILNRDYMDILMALPIGLVPFVNLGIIYFVLPQVERGEKALPYLLIAVGLSSLIIVLATVLSIGVLEETVSHFLYPFLIIVHAVDIQQTFLERIDILFMVMWCLAAFNILVTLKYWLVGTLMEVTGSRSSLYIIFLAMPLLYIVSIVFENIMEIMFFMRYFTLIALYTLLIMPLIVGAIAWIRGLKEEKEDDAEEKGPKSTPSSA